MSVENRCRVADPWVGKLNVSAENLKGFSGGINSLRHLRIQACESKVRAVGDSKSLDRLLDCRAIVEVVCGQ